MQRQGSSPLLQYQEGGIRTHQVRPRDRFVALLSLTLTTNTPSDRSHRSQISVFLEHQTGLRLRDRNLPFQIPSFSSFRSHHLGRHHPRSLRTLAPKHLHPPPKEPQIPLAPPEHRRRKPQILPRRHQPRYFETLKPKAQIPNHNPLVQDWRGRELYFAVQVQCAALGGCVVLEFA